MVKLHNLIPAGDSCGWGVAGTNLSRHLPSHCEVVSDVRDADVVLVPVDNRYWGYGVFDARTVYAVEKKIPIVGYGFHEFDILGSQQIEWLPKNYSALACGSSWMTGWVKRALQGVADDFPVETVLQGVDHDLFKYMEPDKPDFMKGRFVVASAGKFEYRKAQDVVIEVFRRFKRSVPEAMLLLNWTNLWESSMITMNASKWSHNLELESDAKSGVVHVRGVSRDIINPADQMAWILGPNSIMPNFYRNADAAIFPNRCEAGQALPACESVASCVPSILTDAHGMCDLADAVDGTRCISLSGHTQFKYPSENSIATMWEPCIDEALSALHRLYRQRPSVEERLAIGESLKEWTWDRTALHLVDLCRMVA